MEDFLEIAIHFMHVEKIDKLVKTKTSKANKNTVMARRRKSWSREAGTWKPPGVRAPMQGATIENETLRGVVGDSIPNSRLPIMLSTSLRFPNPEFETHQRYKL